MVRQIFSHSLLCCACLLTSTRGFAVAVDTEDDALKLADSQVIDTPTSPSPFQSNVELAPQVARTLAGRYDEAMRVSPTVRYDRAFGDGWRAVFDDRFDYVSPGLPGGRVALNSLRELYLSDRPSQFTVFDLGRVNVTNGSGVGFNPTDYFRYNSVRYVVSPDPTTQRVDRLGTVLFRGQTLWQSGSLTAIAAPRLRSAPDNASLSPDLGATNSRSQFLLAGTARVADGFTPQLSLYRGAGESPRFGLNSTVLVNDATVGFFEWSGGRSRSNLDTALSLPGSAAFQQRFAVGLTYTTPSQVSVTVEFDHDGAAPSASAWRSLMNGNPNTYTKYRRWVVSSQELTTRNEPFVRLSTTDVFVKNLDTAVIARYDLVDHSVFLWANATYHVNNHVDLGLQLQTSHGTARSDFGGASEKDLAEVLFTYFL
ncbi:hypothetical protein [Paraburkholderia terricola]|uniref:TIGR03016 family PEP-CTERM system-associated outer membrane protein n=1 Tax=Paraburkholderia terricola TaxID=169427 RepID=A0ABU1M1V3_9BURK|nr:hypothetical protein [Paraburkholderia terricola]MDR6412826.1 hypothetical protein [Paraburkholderia terricola]MDR6450034.1 hypothetical protein [Paraburkholderia terricola]MDR6484902.1 hypothetical protein [Paraburkholderia terricola]